MKVLTRKDHRLNQTLEAVPQNISYKNLTGKPEFPLKSNNVWWKDIPIIHNEIDLKLY